MQTQQENKSLTETSGSSKKNIRKANDDAVFETYATQCKIKPYREPRGPLAQEVILGGSLPDAKPAVQRKTEEEEEPLQGKGNIQLIQKSEEEKPLQGNGNIQLAGEKDSQIKPNNTGLPDNLKSGIENLSGYAMDDVQVHYSSDKPSQLQAHAFAQGTDIHIAPGQEKHLPHEAWHVVQQKQGRVQANIQLRGIKINDNAELEKEADLKGSNALQMKSKENVSEYSVKSISQKKDDKNEDVIFSDNQAKTQTQRKSADSILQMARTPNNGLMSAETDMNFTDYFRNCHWAENEAEAEACVRHRYNIDKAVLTNTTATFTEWCKAIDSYDHPLKLGKNMIEVNLTYRETVITAGAEGIATMVHSKLITGKKTVGINHTRQDSPDFQDVIYKMEIFHVH